MKKASLILFILIQFTTFATVVDYCFEQTTSLSNVHHYLNTVLSPQDEVVENNSAHCLNVVVKNDLKEELYRKWIGRKFKILSSSNSLGYPASTIPQVQEHCRLEVEKISKMDKTTTGVDVSMKTKAYERNFKHSGSQRSNLLLGVGSPGRLRVDDDYINVTCKSRNTSRVFLDISLWGERSSVSTSVTLDKGQTLDLASIVEDLNNRSQSLSLNRGVQVKKTKGQKSYQYFLRIKQ